MEIFLSIVIFFIAFFFLGISIFLANKTFKGSCGSDPVMAGDEELSCGACPKKEKEICPSDDPTGVMDLATVKINPEKH